MGHHCEYSLFISAQRKHGELMGFASRYHAEPSGTFYRYDAKAIGSGSEGAQAELQNEFHKSLTLLEAEVLTLKTLKQVMEEKLDSKNVQLASVTKEKGFRIYTDEEMAAVVARLPTK